MEDLRLTLASEHLVIFHDVSNWEGHYTPSGPIFAKATQGASFVDKDYADNKKATEDGGWPFVAYHYLDARARPAAQAAHALAVIGTDTPVMWDIERGGGTLANLIDCHDAFVSHGGHGRLVYLPHWYWEQLGSPDLRPLVERGLLLVSSNYPAGGYSDTGPGWTPYGQMTPMFWQFTDKPIDTDAFRGTLDQMRALLAIRATGAPKPKPTPTPPAPHPTTYPDHIVKPGDTLFKIARLWDVDLTAVEHANPQAGHPRGNSDVIWPGDRIKHP